MIDFDAAVLAPCMDAFGEMVTFLPVSGPAQDLVGIFNEKSVDTKYQDGAEIVEMVPTLGMNEAQFLLSLPERDDSFTIRGLLWRVADVMPDGHGHLKIRLMLQNDAQANLIMQPPVAPPIVALP